jgi:hypothetical protein
VAVVGTILDFRDLSTSAGELDVVTDLEISHLALPTQRSRFPRRSVHKGRRRFRR